MAKKNIKIEPEMYLDLFKNLHPDSRIQPLDIFNQCLNEVSDFIHKTKNSYYEQGLNILEKANWDKLVLPEFIFHAYLKSIIEYDIQNELLLNNDDLLNIVETLDICKRKTTSNHITLFRESFAIYEEGKNIPLNTFSDSQSMFYNFLSHYGIIKSTPTTLDYAVPLHITPIFISIINVWDYSPISNLRYGMTKHLKNKASFQTFKKRVIDTYLKRFNLNESYNLFGEYFIYYFFGNSYITTFCVDTLRYVYEYTLNEAELLLNESYKYNVALCKINHSISYLALKKIFVLKANDIYQLNTAFILAPNTTSTKIDEIAESINNFIQALQNITDEIINDIEKFIKKNIIIKDENNSFKLYPKTETYFESLQRKLNSYKNKIVSLTKLYSDFFYYYTYYDHKTIKTIFNGTPPFIDSVTPIHYTNMIDFNPLKPIYYTYKTDFVQSKHKLRNFIQRISELLEETFKTHTKRLEQKNTFKENSSAINYKQLLLKTSHNNLKNIKTFITGLEIYYNNRPPVQKYDFPKSEISYEPLINSINAAAIICQKMFMSFYNKLSCLANNSDDICNTNTANNLDNTDSKLLWQTLHICISDNLKTFKKNLDLPK